MGSLGAVLEAHLAARRFLIDFWIDFRVVLGAQKGAGLLRAFGGVLRVSWEVLEGGFFRETKLPIIALL